jgi:hypothetical protein
MFIREVWMKDRKAAIVLVALLSIYMLLHIIKLEVFPLYLFPMYSLPKETGQLQYVYKVKNTNGEEVDFSSIAYRRFVYIHNTLKAYDEVLQSPNQRPNVIVIDKFVQRLGIREKVLGKALLNLYSVQGVDEKMQGWLSRVLEEDGPFQIDKCTYKWESGELTENSCKMLNP